MRRRDSCYALPLDVHGCGASKHERTRHHYLMWISLGKGVRIGCWPRCVLALDHKLGCRSAAAEYVSLGSSAPKEKLQRIRKPNTNRTWPEALGLRKFALRQAIAM